MAYLIRLGLSAYALILHHYNELYPNVIEISRWSEAMLLTPIVQILLIAVLAGLAVLTVSVCMHSTKASLSTAALKKQLLSLQSRVAASEMINPELERQLMEVLQNKMKTSGDPLRISGDAGLRRLFDSNYAYVRAWSGNPSLKDRSSWIKLRELMSGFDEFYFKHKAPSGRL